MLFWTRALYFSAAENEIVEVRAEGALLRPGSCQPTQAQVTILAPKVLQITARHGGLNFSYHGESRNLPEGATYRICLDDPAEAQSGSSTSAQKAGLASKVTYFIVGAGAAGLTAWGIHHLVTSSSNPVSPARP
jgi:hypothetical protein